MSYKGELLSPVLFDYPESKFGGFLAVTDYKDPVILDEIKANGWAIWPPIRYSYDTINKDYPGRKGQDKLCLGYPAPPPWASSAPLCDAPPDQLARFNAFGNTNWLGLDNQGRDVVARVIYGFRISVLFGLLLAMFSAAVGVTAGAVQGYFGGRTDLIFQRFLEIWSSVPSLFVLIIISSVLVPGFWTLLAHAAAVRVGQPRRRRARRVPARAQLRIHHRGPRARPVAPQDHVEAHAAQRDGGDADLPAVPAVGQHRGADGARLPRPRPAARLAVARRIAAAGQAASRSAVARPHRLLHRGADAVAADLHRRGGARRARPPQDVPVGAAMASVNRALLDVRDLSVAFGAAAR